MSYDCSDICNAVYTVMCKGCPDFDICQEVDDDEWAHENMIACLREHCEIGTGL